MEKVILDTDIGSDIDDAFALGYLLNQPECELLGITTVSGEAYKRAQLCRLMAEKSGKDVGVYSGIERPILNEELQPLCPQAEILNRFSCKEAPKEKAAIEFLRETILKHPHEITLIAIGPFTNLGVLFTLDPDLAQLLKRVVIMGGKVSSHPNDVGLLDWNVLCDPIAAKILFDAPVKELVIFPCDVTYPLHHPAHYLEDNVHGRYRELITEMSKIWFKRFDGFSYHDPMAALYPFEMQLMKTERGKMSADLTKSAVLSYTRWEKAAQGNHLLVKEVDYEVFLKKLYPILNQSEN